MAPAVPNTELLDGLIEGCQIISLDWRYLYLNDTAVAQARMPRAQLIGRTMNEVFPGIDQTPLADDIRRCMTTGAYVRRENEFTFPDGSLGWFELRMQRIPQGVFILSHDITELKRAAEAHRRSEEKYRQMVETTSEGVVTTDRDARIVYANARFAQMLGHEVADVLGRTTFEFMDAADQELAQVKLERRRRGEAELHEHRFRHRTGRAVWMRIHSTPLIGPNGKPDGAIALTTDVTEARAAEQTRSRLAAIVESSSDAIIARDLEGTLTAWNTAAEKLFGYSAAEAVGQPADLLVPPELLAQHTEAMAQVVRGERPPPFETKRQRKDGTLVDLAVTVSPIRDAEQRIIGISKTLRDLTAERQVEAALRRSEAQLRQSQKMEAIGSLAGGIAHDFNNLLSVIMSFTGMAIDDLHPEEPIREGLVEVMSAAERAAGLTRQLLAFSRQQIIEPVAHDLNQSVRALQKMLGRVLGEQIELAVLDAPDLGRAFLDPGQFEQVVMNLVVNARDAMPNGGRLTIETSNVELDAGYAATHHGVTPGRYVMLAVTDTGTGMDPGTVSRIFDPFFTTKGPGKGTGLGLSTVYGIVNQSGGHIWVYSEPARGTTFKVYFPQTDAPLGEPSPPIAPAAQLRGTETILLVEDEDPVRATMRLILRRQGYTVLEAANGGEAMLIAEQTKAPIHLLLTDVVMPRMNGPEVAERIAQRVPGLKVLFVSGYSENTIIHHGVLDAGINYLSKPLTPLSLARKVREVLDRR